MDPEPIRRRHADLAFECRVDVGGEFFRLVRAPRDFLAQDDLPLREAIRVNRHGDDRRVCPHGERRGERRGRAEAVEKRGPDPRVAGVLVDEDADNPWLAEEGDRGVEPSLPIKRRHAEPSPITVHEVIDERVAEGLVDGPEPGLGHLEDQLGIQFPVADVVDREHDRAAVRDVCADTVKPLDDGDPLDVRLRDRRDFEGADRVGSECCEVLERERADFRGRLFPGECPREVLLGEPPIAGQDEPHQCSDGLAEQEAHG